jgi:hypothetical protein
MRILYATTFDDISRAPVHFHVEEFSERDTSIHAKLPATKGFSDIWRKFTPKLFSKFVWILHISNAAIGHGSVYSFEDE